MTRKENLLRILEGKLAKWVPFAPNIGQWFAYHKENNILPEELRDCKTELDAMLKLECDIFSRRISSFQIIEYHGRLKITTEKRGNVTTTIIETPFDKLLEERIYQKEGATSYISHYFWKDFNKEYKAVRYYLEHTDYHFNDKEWKKYREVVGDNGVIMIPINQTPLKLIYNLASLENGTFFIMDHENEIKDLMDIHTEKTISFLKEALQSDGVVFISMDNLDSVSFSPGFIERYCKEHFLRIADIVHREGKYLFSHACGQLRSIIQSIRNCKLDGLEGITHLPLGDLPYDLALNIHDRFIVNGGMSCYEQEVIKDAKGFIFNYVKRTFNALKPFRRFIFSSSCNTSIKTPFKNLLYFREACREFGRN